MSHPKNGRQGLSRRQFLEKVGIAGGAAALYETMTAMGMINKPQAWAGPPKLKRRLDSNHVVILGAGVGGLTAAYQLRAAGYEVTILEAQDRVGGRSYTVRRGDKIVEESALHGRTEQECKFDEGLYLNAGPGRLPYHHRRVLHYCKELGVPLEVYVMNTTANLFQTNDSFAGEAQIYRRVANDTRGYISELLAKAVNQHALDDMLDGQDRENLLSLLKSFGDLGYNGNCDDLTYCGSSRSGCRYPMTVYNQEECEAEGPLPFQDLLNSKFWDHRFYQPEDYLWQPTLFQPVGGMDQIVKAFEATLINNIHTNAAVQRIKLAGDKVEVYFNDNGSDAMIEADYCVSNIPIPVLQNITANFSDGYRAALNQGRFAPTCKVGWQANTRFWESDKYQIYGGISWIDEVMTQMWYPSYDYFTEKGTMTGAYNFSERAIAMGNMSLAERLQAARRGAVRLHDEFYDFSIVPENLGLSIAWHNVPFQKGGWAEWTTSNADNQAYRRLLEPDGRFHMVGDQVSSLPGWQEGAMMSAEHVVSQINGIRAKRVPRDVKAPDSKALTEGR